MENHAKKCSICGQTLTLDKFRKVFYSPDGYAKLCKECAKKRRAEKKAAEPVETKIGGGNPELQKFKPFELIEELRFRGYTGTLEVKRTIRV